MADELKKNIDNEEIELDALEDVNGGAKMYDPGVFRQVRVRFTEDDVEKIKEWYHGANISPYREYTRGEINQILGCDASNKSELALFLKALQINVEWVKY